MKWLLWLGLILSSACAYGSFDCAENLADLKLRRLNSFLRHPDSTSKDAIREIITYLKDQPGDGETKFRAWQEFAHLYNQRRTNYWINAPSLRTEDGDFVCWGEVRGHLLIFRADGAIFKSYNPRRPNPQSGYQIDWSDPTLK